MIDLYQKVTIIRSGGVDRWGEPLPGTETEYWARVDEVSEKIRDAQGNDVVPVLSILLEGLADVEYTDTVEFTNELGHKYSMHPKKISPIRDYDGIPILTEVVL